MWNSISTIDVLLHNPTLKYIILFQILRENESISNFSAFLATPDNITWGLESRNTMIRVIARGSGKSTYLENRSPGAAMNPFLGLAGTVAAGMDGIRNKLELSAEGPLENEYGKLPGSLEEALQALENDEVMVESLGPEFVDWFGRVKRDELCSIQRNTELNGGDGFKAEFDFYSRWI